MRCSFAAVLALLLFGSGCAAQRYTAPERPQLGETPPADLGHVSLSLKSFDITNQSEKDLLGQEKRALMRRAFLNHLNTKASLGLFIDDRWFFESPAELDEVELRVTIAVEETANHTILFDGLFFYPGCGIFPFTPIWGEAIVTGTIEVLREDEKEPPIVVRVSAPYSMIFYSWYRVGPIEDAFARAHTKLYEEMITRLVDRLAARPKLAEEPPVLVATATAATSTEASVHLVSTKLPQVAPIMQNVSPLAAMPSMLPGSMPANIILPPDDFGVIFRPTHRERDDDFITQYLASLGGIEMGVTGGRASVQSRARRSDGTEEIVGSGRATSSGYRLSLYKPPSVTGFFFPPTVGLLEQKITISGFRDEVPLFEPEGTRVIGAVVSDPETGARVDPGEPIAYGMKLRSGHVGQAAGLNLVLGTEDVQLYSTIIAGINVFEVRHAEVQIYRSRVRGMSVAAFQSGNFGGQIGLLFPEYNLGVRASGQIEWYAAFSYPEPVDFHARTRFNQAKRAYEREVVKVTGASLTTLDWQLSMVVLF